MVVADAAYGPNFWKAFCQHGRHSRGLEYLVLCLRPGQTILYSDEDAFGAAVDGSAFQEDYGNHQFSHDELQRFAADFERDSSALISDILQSDRHLGRGYSYSGLRHPMSPLAEKASYWDSLALIKQMHDFYRDLLNRERVETVLLGGIASLPLKLLCVVARMTGVKVRVIASARVGNRFIWARDEFFSIPQVTEAWRNSTAPHDGDGPGPDTLGVYAEAANYQNWFSRRFTLAGLARESFHDIRTDFLQFCRRRLNGKAPKAGRYFLGSRLRNHVNVYTDYRIFSRCWDSGWARPGKTPYVFLPLHVEPEASLTVFSPEFNSQIAMIDLLAKSLPAGVPLVVKEHRTAIGRRPQGFYPWLKSIPGVVLAPLEANGSALARSSRATVTITGTAGFEAAVAGVPVLAFGEHNFYNTMDHVHVIRDLDKLRPLLKGLLQSDKGRAEARSAGKRFFDTLIAESIDLGGEVIAPRTVPSKQAIELLFDGFWSTLEQRV